MFRGTVSFAQHSRLSTPRVLSAISQQACCAESETSFVCLLLTSRAFPFPEVHPQGSIAMKFAYSYVQGLAE